MKRVKFSKIFVLFVALFALCYLPAYSVAAPAASAPARAQRAKLPQNVFELAVPSPSMNKKVPVVVVLPESYKNGGEKRYPVIYLLHGHGGNHFTWLRIRPDLAKLASRFSVIFVCPDGFKSSWYWDSPVDKSVKYETFVSKELVEYIDANYRTNASPKGRAITGLSMGGHGGLWLGFRHQDVYGACGSMSGGVDIRPFPRNWGMASRLGTIAEHPENWDNYTVMTQLDLLKPDSAPRIAFECGVDDFFFGVNEKLHAELLKRKIPHDYTTRPGKHNSAYWKNALPYQIYFFSLGF